MFIFLILLILWSLNYLSISNTDSIISLTFSISMFVSSGFIIFWNIPTYQHIRLISFIPIKNAPFALLSALRIFDIISLSSSQIILAQRTRGIIKDRKLLFTSYVSNIFVLFLENLYNYFCNVALLKKITFEKIFSFSFLLLLETLKLSLCLISLII
jgi:hypothetical protein